MTENPYEPSREDIELLQQAEEQVTPGYSEIAAEDLSTEDLVDDGVPVELLEQDPEGIEEFNRDLADPSHRDTIEERLAQEEPDQEPGFGG